MPDTALPDTTVVTESFWTPNVRQQVITQCTSATRPTGVEGRYIHETDTDLLYCHNGTGWEQVGGVGGWTSYTPTLTQGAAITLTVNYSKWTRGPRRTITWNFHLTCTTAGTGGSGIVLTVPVTAAAINGLSGQARFYDTSTVTSYVVQASGNATTTVVFYHDTSTASALGAAPAVTIANGDVLTGSITYEAAA
jgi:hypothetical protein